MFFTFLWTKIKINSAPWLINKLKSIEILAVLKMPILKFLQTQVMDISTPVGTRHRLCTSSAVATNHTAKQGRTPWWKILGICEVTLIFLSMAGHANGIVTEVCFICFDEFFLKVCLLSLMMFVNLRLLYKVCLTIC